MNQITLKAYSTGTTIISTADLDKAQGVTFSTLYPGGLYGELSFFLPRNVLAGWPVNVYNRIAAYNGMEMVWEGVVSQITPSLAPGSEGLQVSCLGYWGARLMMQSVLKPWADSRLDNDAWIESATAFNASDITPLDLVSIDRNNRARFTPRSTRDAAGAETGWTNGQYARLVYTAPTGHTIKRVTAAYDLQEGAQAWQIGIYNQTSSAIEWSVSASGTSTVDQTLANPAQVVWLYFMAKANQSPPTDGTVYGQFSSVVVYTETGAIDGQQVAIDCAALVSELSTDTSRIGALTYALVPFVSIPARSIADTLYDAVRYGDSSNNLWAAYVWRSDKFSDGKPGLVVEQQPALTDYDYVIRLDDLNIGAEVQFSRDLLEIRNYYIVEYRNEEGRTVTVTPEDDATLKDTTSIAAYGRMDERITVDTASQTLAIQYAKTLLAKRKTLQWKASSDIPVVGWIKSKSGGAVPACQITAGKRIRIANYLNDLSGSGLTFLITATSYDDASQTCRVSTGLIDTAEAWLARELFQNR